MAWPRKPPKGQRCDAHVGSGTDALGCPVVYRCENEAEETVLGNFVATREAWVCEPHAVAWEAAGFAQRNPRRKEVIRTVRKRS